MKKAIYKINDNLEKKRMKRIEDELYTIFRYKMFVKSGLIRDFPIIKIFDLEE